MSDNTQYRPICTTKASPICCSDRFGGITILVVIGIVIISFPLTFYYGLEYHKRNQFSTEPSYCRVNKVGKAMIGAVGLSPGYEWNIDIVKQSQDNNSTKDLIVLRSNITGFAWDNSEQPHLVSYMIILLLSQGKI
jgi:hypothetical protein